MSQGRNRAERGEVMGWGAEIAEGFEDVEGAKLEGGVVDLGGVEVGREVGGRFLAGAGLVEPSLFEEPVLVAALLPLGEVIGFEADAVRAKALDDLGVGEPIEEPLVDLVADGFGQAGNLAVAAIGEGGEGLRGIANCRLRIGN